MLLFLYSISSIVRDTVFMALRVKLYIGVFLHPNKTVIEICYLKYFYFLYNISNIGIDTIFRALKVKLYYIFFVSLLF